MQRKIFLSIVILISVIFSFSVCFAQDMLTEATNTIKDTVTNAGNAVEDTMKNTGNVMQDSTEKMENTMENAGNTIKDTGNTIEKDMTNTVSKNMDINNNTYTATRTSTDNGATFMGMNATAWTWLILGITAIGIIAIVWYYSMQITSENNHSRRD